MALSSDKIDAIRQGADIVRVIGARLSLKKQGRSLIGLCPFHSEDTPSFSVSPEKGLFYCFGCHAGGDVFTFLMRHEGLAFHEAARQLAQDAGVELAPESPELKRKRKLSEDVAKANEYALAFFTHQLTGSDGEPARRYLEGRGIGETVTKSWSLGYGGGSGAMLHYLQAKKVPFSLAAKAGFLSDDGKRGLFDGRVIFPIRDAQGRLAGFGGRRLEKDRGPKYVNSRESLLFSKRHLLYGWAEAEDPIRRTKRVVLVEGFMDVLACHSSGVTSAVASLGTAFTEEHAKACKRLATEALVLFDADRAGQEASREATEKLFRQGFKVSMAPLPEGEDPDSFSKAKGAKALVAHVEAAQPALEHFINTAVTDDMSIEDKSRQAQSLAPLILSLASGLEREMYTARLAERVGVSADQMQRHLAAAPKPKVKREKSPPARSTQSDPGLGSDPGFDPDYQAPQAVSGGADYPGSDYGNSYGGEAAPVAQGPGNFELKALAELMLYPPLRARLSELAEFTSDPMRVLLDELTVAPGDEASAPDFGEVLARHVSNKKWVQHLVAVKPIAVDSAEEAEVQAERTFQSVVNRFKERLVDAMRKDVVREMEDAEARGEDTTELLRRSQNLQRRKDELKRMQMNS